MQKHLMVALAATVSMGGIVLGLNDAGRVAAAGAAPQEQDQVMRAEAGPDESPRILTDQAGSPGFGPLGLAGSAGISGNHADGRALYAIPQLPEPPSDTEALLTSVLSNVAPPSIPIQAGWATWYGAEFNGHTTYCGDTYDQAAYTAASNTLPCNTVVIVRNQETGSSVRVRITDRGAFGGKVIMDLSQAAFSALSPTSAGVVAVTVALPGK
jgi:rare lipoprotein A